MTDLLPIFTAQRPRLLAIAYRMLGSATAAEDVLQEAWLRVRDTDDESLRTPAAFLRTVVVRLCLDQLKSAQKTRQSYIGPWLPEPVPAEPADLDTQPADARIDELESISMAFLLILETLSPLERAAFLLREVFEYDFDEIATSLGRSAAACRQLFHRAQQHVEARRPRYRVARAQHLQIMQAFMAASARGDAEELSRLLRADVVATSDGGGVSRAARKPVLGRDRVTRFIVGLGRRGAAGARVVPDWLNGCPAFLFYVQEELKLVLILESDGAQVTAVRFILAPAKLRYLRERRGPQEGSS
jgi:RNA polymerase sigma-70 factor (ECF subfamily)